jgi:hypothetical protein
VETFCRRELAGKRPVRCLRRLLDFCGHGDSQGTAFITVAYHGLSRALAYLFKRHRLSCVMAFAKWRNDAHRISSLTTDETWLPCAGIPELEHGHGTSHVVAHQCHFRESTFRKCTMKDTTRTLRIDGCAGCAMCSLVYLVF